MKKTWLGVAIAVCLALSLLAIPFSGCAGPAPTTTPTTATPTTPGPTTPTATTPTPTVEKPSYQWIISSFAPQGYYFYDLSCDFIRRVEEASDGRMTFTHYPGDLLGDYMTQTKSTSEGGQDFIINSTAGISKKTIGMTFFCIRDFETFKELNRPGGWMYDFSHQVTAPEINIMPLGTIPQGATGIVSNVKFDMMPVRKDVKVRVMGVATARMVLEALGFNPITIPFAEVHSALMLGTVDAAWGPTGGEDFLMFADAVKYAYMMYTQFSNKSAAMNMDLFNSLSPEDQELLTTVGMEWQEYTFDVWEEKNAEAWQEVRDMGVEVYYISDKEWLACAEAAHAVEFPYMEELVGKEWMDKVKATYKEMEEALK